jgi:predicted nucleic acid-binding protein
MITAVDSAILLDVLVPGSDRGPESEGRLAAAAEAGALVICPTVAAELAVYFTREVELKAFLRDTGLRVDPFGLSALHMAGQAWKASQRKAAAAGRAAAAVGDEAVPMRRQVVADFLVGAHAFAQADRLLTCDRAFHRTWFPKLKLGP